MHDLSGSRVLVIGGAGFIGSHIVDQLLAEPVGEIVVLDNFARGARHNLDAALLDERVSLVEGSITDVALLDELMAGTDYVWLLAALWLYECVHEPRSAIEVNCVGTFNVIDAAQRAGVKKVVYSSSASVYGDAVFTPMTEDHPFNNRTMYGATKIAGEQFFRAYHEQHGLDYVGLRYMNVYGPRMDYKGTYVSVIMKVLDRIEAGERPVIFGDGSQAYDFVHVDDVARANILAMQQRRDRRQPQRRHRDQDEHQGARRRAAGGDGGRDRAGVPRRRADVRHAPSRRDRAGRGADRLPRRPALPRGPALGHRVAPQRPAALARAAGGLTAPPPCVASPAS